jgi:hypothetical protein
MSKPALPPKLMPEQVVQLGNYICPLCKTQITSDEVDVGWVYCPMLENQAICLGCCIDHQSVARSDDFDNHTFRGLFDDIVLLTGKNASELRRICLQHQEEVVKKQLDNGAKDEEQLNLLLQKIQQSLGHQPGDQ